MANDTTGAPSARSDDCQSVRDDADDILRARALAQLLSIQQQAIQVYGPTNSISGIAQMRKTIEELVAVTASLKLRQDQQEAGAQEAAAAAYEEAVKRLDDVPPEERTIGHSSACLMAAQDAYQGALGAGSTGHAGAAGGRLQSLYMTPEERDAIIASWPSAERETRPFTSGITEKPSTATRATLYRTSSEGIRSRMETQVLFPSAHVDGCIEVDVTHTDAGEVFISLSGTRLNSAEARVLSEWLRKAAADVDAAKGGAA